MSRIDKIRILSRKDQVTMDRAEGFHTQTVSERIEDYVTAHHTLSDIITRAAKPHKLNTENDCGNFDWLQAVGRF